MGFYIQADENGVGAADKIKTLMTIYHARFTNCPASLSELGINEALLCVIDNGGFAAVAYIYCDEELSAFSDPNDFRDKTWMVMDKAKVEELTGMHVSKSKKEKKEKKEKKG